MGQAKQRGSFDKRKEESIFYNEEQKRLDDWLRKNTKVKRWGKRRNISLMTLALCSSLISVNYR